jgi:hypothetical protein
VNNGVESSIRVINKMKFFFQFSNQNYVKFMNLRFFLNQKKLIIQIKFDDYIKISGSGICTLLTFDLDQQLWILKEKYNLMSSM